MNDMLVDAAIFVFAFCILAVIGGMFFLFDFLLYYVTGFSILMFIERIAFDDRRVD